MSAPSGPETRARILLIAAPLAGLVYVLADAAASIMWGNYIYVDQTWSELSAIGAPTRGFMVGANLLHTGLLVAFAAGVWIMARSRQLRVVAAMLFGIAAVGGFALLFGPMHLRGQEPTFSDTLHIVSTMVIVVLTLVGIGFSAAALKGRFRIYALATGAALLGFGAWAGMVGGPNIAANLPTPWLGIIERVNIYGYLAWVAVLGFALWRATDPGRSRFSARRQSISPA